MDDETQAGDELEVDDDTLVKNAAVQLALAGEQLVDELRRGGRHGRRRATATARRIQGLAAAMADDLSRVDIADYNGR